MFRFYLVVTALFVSTACGGSQSSGSNHGTTEPEAQSSTGEGTSSNSGSENGENAEGGDNQFQVQNSADAGEARGERPSQIEASETHAAMRLFVVNGDDEPIEGVIIKMTGPNGADYFTDETDSHGYAEVLVPLGRRYDMEYLSLGRQNTAASVDVADSANLDLRLTLRYRRIRPTVPEPAEDGRGLVLEGILFATNRATIEPESFPRIDRVVEYLTHRENARIRISGHTDNVGNPRANRRLSESRANAVRDYLIVNGIDENRVEAVGHGDEFPVASNDSAEGRQRNRRIEAVEL